MALDISLAGTANQDHELAGIRDIWEKTDNDMKDEFLSFIEDDDMESVKEMFSQLPASWVMFMQKCMACGLRQCVLESQQINESENDNPGNYQEAV